MAPWSHIQTWHYSQSENSNFHLTWTKTQTAAWNVEKTSFVAVCSSPPFSLWVPAQQADTDTTVATQWTLCASAEAEAVSNRRALVSRYLANVFWLLIYLISFNRSVIEIHQKFLSVHSPPMSGGSQHLLSLHYRGSSLGPLIPQSDRALVTEIINLKTLFAANALQELFTSHASWCLIIGGSLCEINVMKCSQISLFPKWLIILGNAEQLDIVTLLAACCFCLLSADCLLADGKMTRHVSACVWAAFMFYGKRRQLCGVEAMLWNKAVWAWITESINASLPLLAERSVQVKRKQLPSVHLASYQSWTCCLWLLELISVL